VAKPGQPWTGKNQGRKVIFGELTPTWRSSTTGHRKLLQSTLASSVRLNDFVMSPYGGYTQDDVGSYLFGGYWDDGKTRFCRWDSSNRLIINKKLRTLLHVVPVGVTITRLGWCLRKDKAILLYKYNGLFYIHSYTIQREGSSADADNLFFVAPDTSVTINFTDTAGKHTLFSQDSRTLAYAKTTSTGALTRVEDVISVRLSADMTSANYLPITSYSSTDRDFSQLFSWTSYRQSVDKLEMQGVDVCVYTSTFSQVYYAQSTNTTVQEHSVQMWRLPISNNCSSKYTSRVITDSIFKDVDQSLDQEGSLSVELFSGTKDTTGGLVGWVNVGTSPLGDFATASQQTVYARTSNLTSIGIGSTTLCGFNIVTSGGEYATDDMSFYSQELPPDVHSYTSDNFKKIFFYTNLKEGIKLYVEYLGSGSSQISFTTCRVVFEVGGTTNILKSWNMPVPITASSLSFLEVTLAPTHAIGKVLLLFRFYADRGNTSLGSRYVPTSIVYNRKTKEFSVDAFISDFSDMDKGISVTI
jgi:hypothetical protein